MNNTIKCISGSEFKQVADFYKFDSYISQTTYDEACQLYVENDEVIGWDKRGANSFPLLTSITFNEWLEVILQKPKNNMKYSVSVNNQQEAQTVHDYLRTNSIKLNEFPWGISAITGGHSSTRFFSTTNAVEKYGPMLDFKTWQQMTGAKLYKVNTTIELTRDYTAIVNYKTRIVTVGCQEIPFSKVTELYNLINQQ